MKSIWFWVQSTVLRFQQNLAWMVMNEMKQRGIFFLFKKALTYLSLPPTTHYWTDFEWKCIETVTVVDNILQRVSYTCKQKSGTKEIEIFVSFCSICQWIILVLFVSQISFLTAKLLSVQFKVKNKADAAKYNISVS